MSRGMIGAESGMTRLIAAITLISSLIFGISNSAYSTQHRKAVDEGWKPILAAWQTANAIERTAIDAAEEEYRAARDAVKMKYYISWATAEAEYYAASKAADADYYAAREVARVRFFEAYDIADATYFTTRNAAKQRYYEAYDAVDAKYLNVLKKRFTMLRAHETEKNLKWEVVKETETNVVTAYDVAEAAWGAADVEYLSTLNKAEKVYRHAVSVAGKEFETAIAKYKDLAENEEYYAKMRATVAAFRRDTLVVELNAAEAAWNMAMDAAMNATIMAWDDVTDAVNDVTSGSSRSN